MKITFIFISEATKWNLSYSMVMVRENIEKHKYSKFL